MLVYLNEPMGATTVDGVFLCGKYYDYGRHGPANVSAKFYNKHRAILKEIPITSKWLEKKFNTQFPECSFTHIEICRLDWGTTIKIAQAIGIKYSGNRFDKPTFDQRKALRNSIRNAIVDLGIR